MTVTQHEPQAPANPEKNGPPSIALPAGTAPESPLPTRRLSFREAVTGSHEPSQSPQASRSRPQGLLPSLDALAAVRRLYDDDNNNPAAILAAAKEAQPEAIPDALFSISARVSSSLFGVSRPALVMGLTGVRDNDAVQAVVQGGDVIHIHRQPGNTLLLYLRTEAAKAALAGQRCQFMGRTLTFDSLNPLSDAFYLDVLGIRTDEVASRMFTGLLDRGCQPIYFNFTYRAPENSITSGIVRFYFNTATCPSALVINGHVCDQIAVGGILYSARARGAQAIQYHLMPNKASERVLRLDLPDRGTAPTATPVSVMRREKRTRSTTPSPPCSENGVTQGDNVPLRDEDDRTLSLHPREDPQRSAGLQNSPSFSSPPRKKVARQAPTTAANSGNSFMSPNYWDVLETAQVQVESHEVRFGATDGSLRITVQNISMSDATRQSNEFAHLSEVCKGKVRRTTSPVPISTTVEHLEEDVELQKALLQRELDDKPSEALLDPTRTEELAVTSDDLRRSMCKNHLRFMGMFFRLLRTKSRLVNDFIRVHMISRAVAAGNPTSCAPIAGKWKLQFGDRCPKTRAELFRQADNWLLDSSEFELYRISEALALFELLLLAACPSIHEHDGWLYLLNGFDSPWIGGSGIRFLHPNALLSLLRSEVGGLIMSHLENLPLVHTSIDCLKALQASSFWVPWEGGVLLLTETQLGLAWSAGSVPQVSA